MSADTGFADTLLAWHARHGRHDLPWQHPRTPYRVWVSEIMLQQTQVKTVIPYFNAFLQRFPTLTALADAPEAAVMQHWAGLGYYARARNLHRAAQRCLAEHGGELPEDFDALLALPGIGRSTAGAILSQAHGRRHAILDGNVKRVLTRLFAIDGDPAEAAVSARLWRTAESLLPATRMADYTQALMDLGATLCTRAKPGCGICPLAPQCRAQREGGVARYPQRKARKPAPERETVMLLLQRADGAVLLERRPGNGIWGGLHSLPEAADEADARKLAKRLARGAGGEPARLPPFTHVFSHFRLNVQALHWRGCAPKAAIADNDALCWLAPHEWPNIGLPAPIKTLLQDLP